MSTVHRSEWVRRLKATSGLPDRAKLAAWHLSGYPVRNRPGVYSRSHEEIGEDLGWSSATVERNMRLVLGSKWLEVLDPGHRGQDQTYVLKIPGAEG